MLLDNDEEDDDEEEDEEERSRLEEERAAAGALDDDEARVSSIALTFFLLDRLLTSSRLPFQKGGELVVFLFLFFSVPSEYNNGARRMQEREEAATWGCCLPALPLLVWLSLSKSRSRGVDLLSLDLDALDLLRATPLSRKRKRARGSSGAWVRRRADDDGADVAGLRGKQQQQRRAESERRTRASLFLLSFSLSRACTPRLGP